MEFPQLQLFNSEKRRGATGAPPHKSGSLPDENREYEIKRLWSRHRTMLRLAVLGHTHKDIAAQVGCTPQTVSNVLNSAMGKKQLELMQASVDGHAIDVAKEITSLHPLSINVLRDILEDEDAPLQLRAKVAMDNLSRGGFSPVVRGTLDVTHTFTNEEIEELKRDAISAGARVGSIVDVEYTEVNNEKNGESNESESTVPLSLSPAE